MVTTDLSILSIFTSSLHKQSRSHQFLNAGIWFFLKWHCLKQNMNIRFFSTPHPETLYNTSSTQPIVIFQSLCSQLFLKKVLYMLSEAVFILSHIPLLLLWKSFLCKPMCKCRSHCWEQRLKVCMSQTICCALFVCSLVAAGGQEEGRISVYNESTCNKELWRELAGY